MSTEDDRLLAEVNTMRALLARIVDCDPFYDDPDEGPACIFCWSKKRSMHAPGCEWVEARELLARIKGE